MLPCVLLVLWVGTVGFVGSGIVALCEVVAVWGCGKVGYDLFDGWVGGMWRRGIGLGGI